MASKIREDKASADLTEVIPVPYLLVSLCCPCYVDAAGKRYFESLWAKDLRHHIPYIRAFTVAVPRIDGDPPSSFEEWDEAAFPSLRIVDLPHAASSLTAILQLPILIARLWKAIGNSDIVHTGVAGWPLPDGWITIPIAKLRKKFAIVVVESDFWRVSPGQPASFKKKWRAAISEVFNRWCVNAADVSFFTHEAYKASLLRAEASEKGHINPASWIEDEAVWSSEEAVSKWQPKLASKELKLIVVGRLVPEKGVRFVLDALNHLDASPSSSPIICDILGEGPLLDECKEAAQKLRGRVRVRCLGTVQYGEPLFDLLADYHALVLPIISNEQPRIVYDVFARALPVLGFNSQGVASCVTEGITGKLCQTGDTEQLAGMLEWASKHVDILSQMGLAGLEKARSLTHSEMHKSRRDILIPLIKAHIGAGQ